MKKDKKIEKVTAYRVKNGGVYLSEQEAKDKVWFNEISDLCYQHKGEGPLTCREIATMLKRKKEYFIEILTELDEKD